MIAPTTVDEFITANCLDCHSGAASEAGFDLEKLPRKLQEERVFDEWVSIYDRVQSGEMPPPDLARIDRNDKSQFVSELFGWLSNLQQQEFDRLGRVRGRRLTSKQLEQTLHDLLGIDIPLSRWLPSDERKNSYSTDVANQSISHFHLKKHLSVVDAALDEAFRRATTGSDHEPVELNANKLARTRVRTREPELIDGEIVVWSGGLIFYGRLPATSAKQDGWYRFTVRGLRSLKTPKNHGVWTTVRSGLCVSSAPLLAWVTAFEATEEDNTVTFDAWLPQDHMLEIRPGDATLKQAKFKGGQATNGEGGAQDVPGIAIDSITMQQIHRGPDGDDIRKRLLGDFSLQQVDGKLVADASGVDAREEIAGLIDRMAQQAFRRPTPQDTVGPFIAVAHDEFDSSGDALAALRAGYRALLCSPRFLYFSESPGKLDDHAVASRLSYFLTNSLPDAKLRHVTRSIGLQQREILLREAERLLQSSAGQRFVPSFAAEWLDLDQIDFTIPDRRKFREFDAIVQHSMLAETEAFLRHAIDENLPVTELISADHSFLNSRLARYYGIECEAGDELIRVSLPANSQRRGLLTHGAILKVTANGTTTSPVVRGAWVAERLLGYHIPEPPDNVPAIEPDVRGATSIRDMLEQHRADTACASCHAKIDPAGFVLETFDPAGQWRDRYPGQTKLNIDPSYSLPDGREFSDLNEFRELVITQPERLARNFAKHLLAYGTGRPITFADRTHIDKIVAAAAQDDYGLRSLLREAIASPVFVRK